MPRFIERNRSDVGMYFAVCDIDLVFFLRSFGITLFSIIDLMLACILFMYFAVCDMDLVVWLRSFGKNAV